MKTPFFLFSMISSALLLSANSYRFGGVSHCASPLLIYSRTYPFVSRATAFSPWSLCMRVSRSSSSSLSGSGSDNSKGQKHKNLAPVYSPKTANQKTYCSCLSDPNASIVLGVGPAGTGKTLFACITAIQMLRRGEIHKIVLTRPVVAVEEELGFLPGNMVMKMDPWTRPIFDVFLEYYAQKDVDAMVQSGTIEISPLAYMRGRTFKRAFIIADEMQNSSPNQMLMLITRIGEGSKMVITGDLKQSDRLGENGLNEFMNKIGRHQVRYTNSTDRVISVGGIRAVELLTQDVERSAIVKQVLALYEEPTFFAKPTVPTKNDTISRTPDNGSVQGITGEDLSSQVILNTTVTLDSDVTSTLEIEIGRAHV
jgi:phosphate starvation-inducible PhoH-like protein